MPDAEPIFRIQTKPPQDIRSTSCDIGRRGSCGLVIDDPLIADRHARITYDGLAFILEDMNTAGGTFLNGLAIKSKQALKNGDKIVIGLSKIAITIEASGETPTLSLDPQAKSFYFVKNRPGEHNNDPDRWVRSEVSLGRLPFVKNTNWIVLALALLALPLLFLDRVEEPFLDPGPLSTAHARLFSSDAEIPAAFASLSDIAQQGCQTCHDLLHGTPMQRCSQCHADLMQNQHPFRPKPGNDIDPAIADVTCWPDTACVSCHVEHCGKETNSLSPPIESTEGSCEACHRGTDLESRGFKTQRQPSIIESKRTKRFQSYAFAHDDHGKIACTLCHNPDPSLSGEDIPWDDSLREDFLDVPYETCAGCHVEDNRREDWAEFYPDAEKTWAVKWHGTDNAEENCGVCHSRNSNAPLNGNIVASYGPELKTVERLRVPDENYTDVKAQYDLAHRSHQDMFKSHSNGEACSSCHKNAQQRALNTSPQSAQTKTFWHAVHMDLSSKDFSGMSGDPLNPEAGTCVECHRDLASSESLVAGGLFTLTGEVCGTCHREDENTPLIPEASQIDLDSPTLPLARSIAANFPHRFHLDTRHEKLSDGCYSCHEFESLDSSLPFASIPTTKPEAMLCTSCHSQHENVGGGECRVCHPSPEGQYNVYLGSASSGRGVVGSRVPPERPWPTPNAFNHYSIGHRADSIDKPNCTLCHKGIEESTSLKDLPVPTESDSSCRDCHLESRQRFHWR